jgi:heme exporter protein A
MNAIADGLSVEKVHVWRGDRHVLKGVSLNLRTRQLLHVSGPNGTGKTTLLRVVCGLLRPEQGQVSWLGASIASVRTEYQVTIDELRASLERTGVAACADLPARVLSAGQRRRVAMARVLAMNASLWLLDEPFTNLDAAGTDLMTGLLQSHVELGGAALVVAHHDLKIDVDMHRLDLGL